MTKDIMKEKLCKILNVITFYLEKSYNNIEVSDELFKLFGNIDNSKLLSILSIIEEEVKKLEFNVNYKLWLDSFFSRLIIGG